MVGCAIVTSYGKKPEQDVSDKDTYSFSVYANQFATKEHIGQFAVKQIEEFMAEHGYVSYRILERYMPTSVIQPVIYKVKFSITPKKHMIHVGADNPLIKSAFKGYIHEVKTFIERGADVNSQNKDGWTALIAAASKGHTEIVKILLAKGADVNDSRAKEGFTALMAAATWGHSDTAKVLIAEGADINAKTSAGITALKYADHQGHTEIVQLLKKAAAK
jgi:hypothetical protein